MCLLVKYVVNNKTQARVQKAWKYLCRERGGFGFVTPYRYTLVPSDGLLVAGYHNSRRVVEYGRLIGGGYIHSYYRKNQDYYAEFEAFAIGVVAWGGDEFDQVSRAVYIPKLDKTELRDARVKMLSSKRIPSVKQLVKLFPALKSVAKYL